MYTLTEKSEVCQSFKKWLTMVERQLEEELQPLKCDNGVKYVSLDMEALLFEQGNVSLLAVPHNTHQSAVAEQLNGTVCNFFHSMVKHRKNSDPFWAEAFKFHAHVRNRVASREIPPTTTPYELLFELTPDFGHSFEVPCRCW